MYELSLDDLFDLYYSRGLQDMGSEREAYPVNAILQSSVGYFRAAPI
jgi:hypothetical protein